MAGTKAGSRLRVLVPNLAFVKRGDVTRHLRKEGFEVIPSVPSSKELVRVLGIEQPDAVIIDTETIRKAGGGTIQAIRAAAPATKVLLMAPGPPAGEEAGLGADAHVEAGADVGVISGLILDLCREPTIVLPESETVAKVGETAPVAPVVALPEAEGDGKRRGRLVLPGVLLVLGVVLIAVSVVAAILQSGRETTTTAAPAGGAVLAPPAQPTEMDRAYSTLTDLVAALRAGRYVEAGVDAQLLMGQRQAARQAGFSVSTLDADIAKALQPLIGGLPALPCASLADILAGLMPACPTQLAGAGVGTLSLSAGTSTGSTSTITGGGGGTPSTGGGGGGSGTRTFPGKGNHSGWVHKPPQGGRHGGPPPWAHGRKKP